MEFIYKITLKKKKKDLLKAQKHHLAGTPEFVTVGGVCVWEIHISHICVPELHSQMTGEFIRMPAFVLEMFARWMAYWFVCFVCEKLTWEIRLTSYFDSEHKKLEVICQSLSSFKLLGRQGSCNCPPHLPSCFCLLPSSFGWNHGLSRSVGRLACLHCCLVSALRATVAVQTNFAYIYSDSL